MKDHSVESSGLRLRWEEQGNGEPIVFIHGLSTGPQLWRRVIPFLSRGRALAWEMVGYGRSMAQGRGRDISLSRQADYLIQWMDAVEIDEAVLVGHDLGGGVAQIAAVRHPERVRGLVLMNAVCYDSWPIPSVKMLRAMGPLVARCPDAVIYLIMAVLFFRGHDSMDRMKESLEIHWRPYAEFGAADALVRQVQSLDVQDTLAITDGLSQLQIPSALV